MGKRLHSTLHRHEQHTQKKGTNRPTETASTFKLSFLVVYKVNVSCVGINNGISTKKEAKK